MFYIVESEHQINTLKSYGSQGAFLEVITSHDNFHPKLNSLVAIYLRPLQHKQGYILPIDHPEGLNISIQQIYDILSNFTTLYVFDKKECLYYLNIKGLTDISLLYSMTYFERLEKPQVDRSYDWFYGKFRKLSTVNRLIPISKLHEYSEQRYDKIKQYIELEIPSGFDFYNNTATSVFYLLEQQGLGIFYDAYNQLFTPNDPRYNVKDNVAYTSYNLYNSTSRPTNAFNSVNFAAIPKGEEYRKTFKPQNDYFVEFDFDGYHVRLLAEQIKYSLTSESAHKQLAKLYFRKDEITDEEYAEAKQINFQAMYGKIPEQHNDLQIFKAIQQYIDQMWKTFEQDGVVYNVQSKKPFTKNLRDMHPSKLMNYMMQSLETSRNIRILVEVLRYLDSKKTKVALYTYDAILFDFCKDDGKQVLEELKTILEEDGKFPVKLKASTNLVL